MELRANSELQGGKYRIIKTLGQGGFGITYLAEQTMMGRRVCIKEFFLKEYCNRDDQTSQVSLGTVNNKSLMEKYQEKFIKEARLIARFDHPNVIRIHDVFAENNTAYYVMDFIEGSSLNDIVKMNGPMAEPEALRLIKAVGDGLSYVHAQGVNHLDVKPGNIMVRDSDGKPVLIDFGMSKQYDEGGEQTSSTPIGISEGYAPLEQYNMGGVSTFSPQTDIYSLAATLYRLVTGQVPPKASEVMNEGLPEMPETVSQGTRDAIEKAMQFRKKDRPAGVPEFLAMLSFSGQPNFDASVPASVACLDDSSTTLLVEEPSVPSVFTLELKSAPSRIKALSALSGLGFSDDDAFDILLKLPYVLYETSDQDLISRAECFLTDAECDVSVSACESSINTVYHVTVLSLQSRMKALTILTELGFSEDDAFEKLASLPCELVFDSKDEADRVEALLSDAGCDVQVSYSEAPSEQFSLIIESVSSKIKALSALGSIGFSDDEAFELLSSLPVTAFDSIDPDEAENYKSILESSGCQVVLLSGGSASSADSIGSKEYSKYCDTTGELAFLIPKSEMGTLLEILERSAASGDDYAVYLLSLYYERMSNDDKALEYAEKAMLSADKSVSLRGRLQKACIEDDLDSMSELVGKGDAVFNECVKFYLWSSADELDPNTALEGFSDRNLASLARLMYAVYLLNDDKSQDDAEAVLTKVAGEDEVIVDCIRALIMDGKDNVKAASSLLSSVLPRLKQYYLPNSFVGIYYLVGMHYSCCLSTPDYNSALNAFLEGAQGNNEDCQCKLGEMLLKGKGCTKDIDKAIEWLEKAEANGAEDARSLLYKAKTIKRSSSCKVSSWSFGFYDDGHNFCVQLDLVANLIPQGKMFALALCQEGKDLSNAFVVIMFNAASKQSYSDGTYRLASGLWDEVNIGETPIQVDAYVFLMDYINPFKEGWKKVNGTINETLYVSDLVDCFSCTLHRHHPQASSRHLLGH